MTHTYRMIRLVVLVILLSQKYSLLICILGKVAIGQHVSPDLRERANHAAASSHFHQPSLKCESIGQPSKKQYVDWLAENVHAAQLT